MSKKTKLKRTLGFAPAYGAAVGLVVSGTAMFSVGHVAGTAGYATALSAFIAFIPMMMTAFAFGELTAMLPGGGMVSDYTLPALGRFWASFALLSGYLVLIATDGGTQLIMGGLALEALCGVPQIVVTLMLFGIVLVINILDVSFYGKVETALTVTMMVIFAALSVGGNLDFGTALGAAAPVGRDMAFLPSGGWKTVLGTTGSAIWFFIGFEFACPMAEENKKPYKNIPYALIIGLVTIYLIDVLFARAAVRYTDLQELASSTIPQTIAAKAMLGQTGYIIMSVLTVLASFTTANAYMSAFPRMLYGLAHQGLVPKCFGRINPRTKTPVIGILFTAGLISVTVIYITLHGADTGVVQGLINTASITWMVSYAMTMMAVLILRKKYPTYPRLWKAPAVWLTMPIGIAGVLYCIYTLRTNLLPAGICMACTAAYCLIWGAAKKIDMKHPVPLADLVQNIRSRSEYLAGWDEAVEQWCSENKEE